MRGARSPLVGERAVNVVESILRDGIAQQEGMHLSPYVQLLSVCHCAALVISRLLQWQSGRLAQGCEPGFVQAFKAMVR